MKTLIIGRGEVGNALYNILNQYYETHIRDKEDLDIEGVDIMHIAFPYSRRFEKYVRQYQKRYKPKYTIIHSTVPVGTSRRCNAIHSPVKGIHPHLEESIKTFTKFLGGSQAGEVADYFRRAEINVYITDKQESTELIKIDSTNWYGVCIEKTKETKELCDKYDVPFELFTLWTQDYNEGYERLGFPQYKRPLLIPYKKKRIGGHCVIPNSKMLNSTFSRIIRKLNGN